MHLKCIEEAQKHFVAANCKRHRYSTAFQRILLIVLGYLITEVTLERGL